MTDQSSISRPDWIKVKLGGGPEYTRLKNLVRKQCLHTVCEEALCPNMGRCWEKGRATLMILGDACTRTCGFCGVASRPPGPPDVDEPRRVADAVRAMGLRDVVLTSVTRDDLADGGAAIWCRTIRLVKDAVAGIVIEVLIPDFGGSPEAAASVIKERPSVLGHNLETVRRLYPDVRPGADYERSLSVLERSHGGGMITKTGIMVGLGETLEEVFELMHDARGAGCDILYIGQYLQPTRNHLPIQRYVRPEEFELYREEGFERGFGVVVSGPLVRSSYHSDEQELFLSVS